MDHETDQIKQLIMYANDAVEGTFSDGTKVFLSPCATEYVIQQGHHHQGVMTTKHRTVYTTSTFLPRIRALISFRNLYAEKPFLVPSLVDSTKCFQSSGTASHVRWSPNVSLPTIDATLTWSWTSLCGRAKIEIPFCRQIIYITHPLQVSRIVSKSTDETNIPTKYVHIFAPVRRCFSFQRLPNYLSKFVCQCLQLIDGAAANSSNDIDEWSFQLPLPLPSTSCPQAHRHRLHHQMMLESDLKVLQTSNVVYRFEYDQPVGIEAIVHHETTQDVTEYVQTCDVQSTFYDYYSIKDQQCHRLTLSEHALPPQNERLTQLIRFMASMRERLLTMARRVQEKPCWLQEEEHDDSIHSNPMVDSFHDETNRSSDLFDDESESIYRQTSVDDVGHFKSFHDNRVQIQFHNAFTLEMTAEQVEFCQQNPLINMQCRIIDKKKQSLIDIFDGLNQPGCYEKYIHAARDWCLWVANEKRKDDEERLAANVQEELFRLKLFRNRMEIHEFQKTPLQQRSTTSQSSSTPSYTPDEIQQILQRTARFTRT